MALHRLLVVVSILIVFSPFVLPMVVAQVFETQSGHVEFTSSVPLHTFTGQSDNLVGRIDLNQATIDFYVDLTTLETGIGKRDKDMRQTLDTDDFPFAEFFGKLEQPFDPDFAGEQSVTVTGTFTMHGVGRPLEIVGTMEHTKEGLLVQASWALNLKDYDIEPPSLLIIKVDEVQAVRFAAILVPVP